MQLVRTIDCLAYSSVTSPDKMLPKSIELIEVSRLQLDAKNPRLGRHFIRKSPSQEEIRNKMSSWTLDELAISFIENGFWAQEALVVLNDEDDRQLTVLEGNRRLAALQLLHEAVEGHPHSFKWKEIADLATPDRIQELNFVPCIKVNDRRHVQAYLGFRHVTGIKQWAPAEKASFITHLIENEGLSYEKVMRRIGSKTPTVRQHYIAYRLLRQIEEEVEDISSEHVEARFSVMYLSLRSPGTQKFLNINLLAEPEKMFRPIPTSNIAALRDYARWLFGTKEQPPLFRDSRLTDRFGIILGSEKALAYLLRTSNPIFEVAERLAESEETAVLRYVEQATDEVEKALSVAHLHVDSSRLREAVDRFSKGAVRLIELFTDFPKK